MVAYGPWTQDPDYEVILKWDREDARDVMLSKFGQPFGTPLTEHRSVAQEGGYSVIPYLDLPAMMSTTLAGGSYMSHVGGAWNDFGYSGAGVEEEFVYLATSSASASSSYSPIVAGTASDSYVDGVSPFRFYPEGDEPDGVIDIEYETDDVSEWLTVALDPTTTLEGTIQETGPHIAGINGHVSETFYSQIRIGDVILREFPTSPADHTPGGGRHARTIGGGPIDLTGYLEPGPYADGVVLSLWTPDFVPASVPPAGGLDGGDWRWRYGWGFDFVWLRWTLRPPRYRWVYDSVPFQQTSHRDDALAGGAEQTWPLPKAYQSGHQTSGGYQ